ncbi:MAG: hypothetical protein N2971_02750 [Chlorobi bacterium]|nr:hypothetical protein [Chlorobiota bacterium]
MTLSDKDFLIAIADGHATEQEQKQFDALREADPRIETYIEILRATRARLRKAAEHTVEELPPELLSRIRREIAATRSQPPALGILQRWWWAAAAVAAAVALIIAAPWQQQKGVDFRAESLENFQRILDGKLSVMVATNNFDTLVSFFRSHGVSYHLVAVPLKAELVGGVISEHNGVKLAHMVYRRNNTLIYMYQAPEELFERGILTLPSAVEPYAESGKWYAENVSKWSWMFWRVQSVYCSVVASVPKEQLATYFVEGTS